MQAQLYAPSGLYEWLVDNVEDGALAGMPVLRQVLSGTIHEMVDCSTNLAKSHWEVNAPAWAAATGRRILSGQSCGHGLGEGSAASRLLLWILWLWWPGLHLWLFDLFAGVIRVPLWLAIVFSEVHGLQDLPSSSR